MEDQARTASFIQAMNRGEAVSFPANWFRSENIGADLTRINQLLCSVEEAYRPELLGLLKAAASRPGLPPLKAELLEFFIGRLADPEPYVFGSPPWFTGLERTGVGPGISLLLPRGEWQDLRQEGSPMLFDAIQRGDHVSRQVSLFLHPVSPDYNIRRDPDIWKPSISVPVRQEDTGETLLLEVPAGIPMILARDLPLGDLFARRIYIQIVASPDSAELEKGVMVRSFIQTDREILAVTFKTFMDRNHILCREEYLVSESGLLLRSLLFRREHKPDPVLFRTAESGVSELLDLSLRQSDINAPDETGSTLILRALERGDSGLLSLLLERGADPDASDIRGERPVSLALDRRDYTALELLLKKGAAPSYIDPRGSTPLILAVRSGDEQAVSLLLKASSWPDFTDSGGITALQEACRLGFPEIVRMLLAANADPGLADREGRTPLYWASLYGWTDIVLLLLESGAALPAGPEPFDPLKAALSRGRTETAGLLRARRG